MKIEARGTDDFTLSVNLQELCFLVDTVQGILAVTENTASDAEKEMCKQMRDAVLRARNQESEHMYFFMGLNLPRVLYQQYDIHLERGKRGPVVVQYLYHVPSDSRIREVIADVPTWVCDSKTLQKFIEEMHPRYWDGDFYEED